MGTQGKGKKNFGRENFMKRKMWGSRWVSASALFCAGVVCLAGCAAGDGTEHTAVPELPESDTMAQQPESLENIEEESGAQDTDSAPGGGQDGTAETGESTDQGNGETVAVEKAQALSQAMIRHYYGGVLSQITGVRQLPDGDLDTAFLVDGSGQMRDNRFAVTDIDGDGREELIVSYSTACMANMFEQIYDYDPVTGKLKVQLTAFPAFTYYDNGFIKAEWSHNQGYGELWPFKLYRYDVGNDSYVEAGTVDTWDKAISETWYEDQPFPDALDTDGDGTLYHICREGEEYTCAYEDYKYNKADYEAWYGELMDGAKEVTVPYQPIAYESFQDYAPVYLRMLAEEAGKERTDMEADLGLLILEEDRFLDAAQKLLSEKYGVTMEQPDPNFEEWTAGSVDGKELFAFEALNAGHISYMGEKFKDVTIFGIYPGISVDGAWEKLKTYGFYASPYGEVENCLITGEGFGNISIWLTAEDHVVTEITVGPYCAFAG